MAYINKSQAAPQTQAIGSRFMPTPPVQAKAKRAQAKMPAWQPSADAFQADSQNPLASLFGHGPDSRQPALIQPKLTLGAVGDPYEQEADRIAAQVVKQINTPINPDAQQPPKPSEAELQAKPSEPVQRAVVPPSLQRAGQSGSEVSQDFERDVQSARGSGRPLEAGLQEQMGQAMGADFSRVQVHTDTQAHQLNRAIQAKAFTTGNDIFFARGNYNPSNRSGQELIAHELTHVVQQGHAGK